MRGRRDRPGRRLRGRGAAGQGPAEGGGPGTVGDLGVRVPGEDDARLSQRERREHTRGLRPVGRSGHGHRRGGEGAEGEAHLPGGGGLRPRPGLPHQGSGVLPADGVLQRQRPSTLQGAAATGELELGNTVNAGRPQHRLQGLGHHAVRPRGAGVDSDQAPPGQARPPRARGRYGAQASDRLLPRPGHRHRGQPLVHVPRPLQRWEERGGRGLPQHHRRRRATARAHRLPQLRESGETGAPVRVQGGGTGHRGDGQGP